MNKLIVVLLMLPMAAMGQDAPLECDNNYGECGTPEMSGGGNQGGGGAILIANTDLGDTYQSADDYDDDGVEDSYDNCPRKPNREQFDSDGDGVGDLCDNCSNTHNLNQWDLDGDGRGDLCDVDLDDDGIVNVSDNCPTVYNADQSNVDGDLDGDACDRDIDGDGLDNLTDPCPMLEGDPSEGSELCAPDLDGDGIAEYGFSSDNCPNVYNPEQYDADLDGEGDACDPDLDGDGVLNNADNCNGVFNSAQVDLDRDGKGDEGCDDHYCYVVFGDQENCLDPEALPKVYSPSIAANTGDIITLRMFSNKPDTSVNYTWTVKERMRGSQATVRNPIGEALEHSLFEHRVNERPTFRPMHPGKYILNLSIDFGDGTAAQHDIEIYVGGVAIPGNQGGGCSAFSQSSDSMPGIITMFLILLGLRRYS